MCANDGIDMVAAIDGIGAESGGAAWVIGLDDCGVCCCGGCGCGGGIDGISGAAP